MPTTKLFLAPLLAAWSLGTWACDCASPKSLSEARDWSYAFVGDVVAVERRETGDVIEELVTFKVTKNVTDVKGGTVQVLFRKGVDPCDLAAPKFSIGDSYTITSRAGMIATNVLYNDFCDLRLRNDKK
jgi:hypothetical protein